MICVYEDEGARNLWPLVDLRPCFDLRCGRLTLLDKLAARYPRERLALWVRDELAAVTAERHPASPVNGDVQGPCLFVSARAILDERVPVRGPEAVLMAGDSIVGFRSGRGRSWSSRSRDFELDLSVRQVKARVVEYPWQLVEFNRAELEREPGGSQKSEGRTVKSERGKRTAPPRGVVVVGPRARLTLARDARVWPGAVVVTETGPVVLDPGAQVRPGSVVEGPCYVGPGTVVDGARVRPGCSFGPECRVGGEVEESVFQGYANKHHDGFLGHCFVGEWANLGAMTTNSDLKNAYREVEVMVGGRRVRTGLTKVGCFFGDHVKTAIGSLFNTGALVGTFVNWFEPGLSPKRIPGFRWGRRRWKRGEAVETARTVMGRRGVELTAAAEALLLRRWRESASRR